MVSGKVNNFRDAGRHNEYSSGRTFLGTVSSTQDCGCEGWLGQVTAHTGLLEKDFCIRGTFRLFLNSTQLYCKQARGPNKNKEKKKEKNHKKNTKTHTQICTESQSHV